jgi:hypothetical protein
MNTQTILYKPLSPTQLAAVIRANWLSFSPDTPGQKIFYPKLHLDYAEKIARQWDAIEYSVGFVVRFIVPSTFINRYDLQSVGYDEHSEYKVPIDELELFNHQIMGKIELVSAFTSDDNAIWQALTYRECVGFH